MTIRFSEYILQEARKNNTKKTQVATTAGTYRKTGEFLHPLLPTNATVLSHGAGLDHTKPALSAPLGSNRVVHDFEPNPEDRATVPEYTKAEHIPHDKYDAAVSHNVLNVIEPHERAQALDTLFNSVKAGGHIVIGARKWSGDVAKTKQVEPAEEKNAVWVKKAGGEFSYQRGFDGDDLKNYVEDHARQRGHQVTVKTIKGIAATGVHVQVHSKGS